MKKIIFLFAPLCAMLMVGCAKDEPEEEDSIQLFAEGFTSDKSAKLAVQGASTYWVNEELIWINGAQYKVEITSPDGSDAVALWNKDRSTKNGYFYAIYPYSASVGNTVPNPAGTAPRTFKVRVPSAYDYKESSSGSGSKQILGGLPMVAYGRTSGSNKDQIDALHFKHITAAITVRVTNSTGDDYIEVEKIELTNNQYQLSGDVMVTYNDDGLGDDPGSDLIPTITTSDVSPQPIPYKQGTPSTVTLNFNGNSPKIYKNTSRDFQIPILPVGTDDSKFTVKVYAKSYTSTSKGRVIHDLAPYPDPYERSTDVGNKSIGRGCLGYAPITFSSEDVHEFFSVTDTTITLKDGTTVSKYFYKISNREELNRLADILDSRDHTLQGSEDAQPFLNGNYIVLKDINMEGDTLVPLHYYNEGGTERVYFYGNGKIISNFVVSSVGEQESNCCGFFGRTAGDNITIENLTLKDATYEIAHTTQKIINYDANYCSSVGGIYSCVDHDGIVIENCHVNNLKMGATNGVQSIGDMQTDFYAGGIVGVVFSSVTIRDCSVRAVTVDNSNDVGGKLIDQFGAAVARIDVGDRNSSNTYGEIVDVNHGSPEDVPAVVIENFKYNQGDTVLQFVGGLKNVRYGGLVGNITRGGRLIMINCSVNHNVEILGKPTEELYISGLIGCAKIDRKMGLHLRSDCSITGIIKNSAADFTSYTNKYVISKYCSVIKNNAYQTLNGNALIVLLSYGGVTSATTCTNTLSVSGYTDDFKVSDQTF